MSPKSKTRKKKPSRRPREERSQYAELLASAAGVADAPSPVVAEMWASEILGSIWIAAWEHAGALDPQVAFSIETDRLLDHLAEQRVSSALVALRALAGVGDEQIRERAARLADKLAADGVPEPAWYTPDASLEFVEANTVSDLFGDQESIAIDFRRGDERYTIMFLVESVFGISGIRLFNTPAEGIDALVRDMIESTEDTFRDEIRHLTADEAWEKVAPSLEELLDEEPDDEARAALFTDEGEHPITELALAQAWISVIEPDDLDDVDDPLELVAPVVQAFLASPHAQDLPDREAARLFAEIAAESAVDEGRNPDQYGPMSLSALLVAEFAMARHVSDDDLALFPGIVRAWAHFSSDHRSLPADETGAAWDEMLPSVLADFERAYREPEMAAERTMSFRSS
ncbi:hypothetical protein Lesp02_36240 [Lentzea sp. NBRC 105346]|uniref:hypothetical protein n=1 Tax=Lentzea sp. NBRC 105346 TaxID=3032205 RepID=UPI0024A30BFC|nr:hypothetical protein [Lentzea sp. NBRC 105346]GLZ31436.1 hypothetical protein Lesp02_36240 [Lentzea sp. NBRC 105346]